MPLRPPRQSLSAETAPDRAETVHALIRALSHAVDGEHRFGNRLDVRMELDGRWGHVIDLIEQLCLKKPPKNPAP